MMASNNSAHKNELMSLRQPADDVTPPPSPTHNSHTRSSNESRGPVAMDISSSKKNISLQNRSNIDEANIESLIEKMRNGLEVSLLSLTNLKIA